MRALFERFPQLAERLPRADLGVAETPVERWVVDGVPLLVKRDDLTAAALGGNKVRALELLLGSVDPQRTLLTVGPTGSTHALAVAQHAGLRGPRAEVITWPQETHDISRATGDRFTRLAAVTRARSVLGAYARAAFRRFTCDVVWIPAGGSSPLGALAHASAALELVAQLAREQRTMPNVIVVPLGSGGTAAGLLAGLALAGARTRVVAVRVVPRAVGNRRHVLRLAQRALMLIQRLAQAPVPALDASRLEIEQSAYGGAYGRETHTATNAAKLLRDAGGPRLDGTYSAKAFGHALHLARSASDGAVLFWLTFDGRWLDDGDRLASELGAQG